jgi:NitT/TauT family transport system permease protein
MPSAMPYFLAGLKIAGGLSLIGAVVAELSPARRQETGLASRILEAGYRLRTPRVFAFSAISHLSLRRWHESAMKREN